MLYIVVAVYGGVINEVECYESLEQAKAAADVKADDADWESDDVKVYDTNNECVYAPSQE